MTGDEQEFDTDDSAVLAAIEAFEGDPFRYWNNLPPCPGEIHPYYRQHRNLVVHWLDHGLFWEHPDKPSMHLAVPWAHSPVDLGLSMRYSTLRREPRAIGLMPYTGEPALYWWWTAHDEYGRAVSGARHIEHVDYEAIRVARGKTRFIL